MLELHRNRLLRRLLLPLFARFNPGDITITHHYTGLPVRLHSFRHKGYWFYGRDRERRTMDRFAALVSAGDTVLEVGGHIGYVSMFLASLVGPTGRVFVFEPGANNLPYVRQNTAQCANVTVVNAGVGDREGRATFFTEDLTGQNNSFVRDFEHLEINRAHAGVKTNVTATEVDITTLDAFLTREGVAPAFLKVDVEGFELEVLRGGTSMLATHRPSLMVEVQANHDALAALADEHGYAILDENLERMRLSKEKHGNTFWIHASRLEDARARVRARR